MKTIMLVVSRLKQYVIKNKSIFVLFVIGGIINSAVFAFMFGNLLPIISKKGSQELNYRYYRVYFNAEERPEGGLRILPAVRSYVSDNDLVALINSDLFNGIMIAADYDGPGLSRSIGSSCRLAAYVYGDLELDMLSGTMELTSENQILIDSWQGKRLGETVILNENEYTVAGIFTYGVEGIITMDAYKEFDLYTNYMSLTTKERYYSGYSESDPAKELLEELFPDGYVSAPERYEFNDRKDSVSGIKTTVFTFVISEIAFIFLLIHMADSLSDENAVSLIVGAVPGNISVLVFLEGVILSCVSVIAGLALHNILYRPFFSKINITEYVRYDLSMYFVMFAIMFAIIVILMLITSIKYSKLSPVKLRRASR